jgi:hypothetical protein
MVKKVMIDELFKVEERKLVKRTIEDNLRKEQERKEREAEEQEAQTKNNQGSPTKNVGFGGSSMGGSPWKKGNQGSKYGMDVMSAV